MPNFSFEEATQEPKGFSFEEAQQGFLPRALEATGEAAGKMQQALEEAATPIVNFITRPFYKASPSKHFVIGPGETELKEIPDYTPFQPGKSVLSKTAQEALKGTSQLDPEGTDLGKILVGATTPGNLLTAGLGARFKALRGLAGLTFGALGAGTAAGDIGTLIDPSKTSQEKKEALGKLPLDVAMTLAAREALPESTRTGAVPEFPQTIRQGEPEMPFIMPERGPVSLPFKGGYEEPPILGRPVTVEQPVVPPVEAAPAAEPIAPAYQATGEPLQGGQISFAAPAEARAVPSARQSAVEQLHSGIPIGEGDLESLSEIVAKRLGLQTKGKPDATRTLSEQKGGEPQHIGTPALGVPTETGGGNRPVGATPQPQAPVSSRPGAPPDTGVNAVEISRVNEQMDKAAKSFDSLKAEAAKFWNSGDVRKQIAVSKDAGESQAGIYGRQMGNEIRQPLKREFPKKAEQALAENALSFVVEAKGDPSLLPEWRTRINESQAASPTWKRKASDAIDFATENWDKLAPLAEKYKAITDKQVDLENQQGIDTLKRNGYVMHEQDIQETPFSGSSGSPTGFRKVRQHDTFADSISSGVDPKSINAVDLLQTRVSRGGRLIANRTWIQGLKESIDPTTKAPVATDPTTVKRADGSTYLQPPNGYTLEYLQHQPVAIQRGYEGIVTAVSDPSWFSRNLGTQTLMKWNGAGKSISLMLDTFHLGRVSFWDSLIKGLGIKTFQAPIPSWAKALIKGSPMKGITLADFTTDQLKEMGRKGEIPKEWLPTIEAEKARIDHLVKGGYNIGRIADAMHQELIRKIPVFGTFNKWLFEQYQRSAMVEVGLLEFERLKSARPEMTDVEVGRRVARDLNTRFGNLGRQGWFKSRTAQDLSRLVALAPEWNQGLIRSELGAVKQAGELVLDTYNGKRLYSGVLLRSVGGMALAQFAANQIINYITRGKPTWENEEEGIGPKLSAWIPDKIGHGAGFFLNPLALAAETTHLLMQKFEKTGDFHDSLLSYLRSRSSVAMRPIMTFITKSDFLGRKLKPGTVWGEMAKDAIPRPIGTAAGFQAVKQAVTGRESESFPGQFQRQALSSLGVRTDVAPSAASRMATLAREFNRERGITPSAEFYVGDYQPIASALSIHNEDDAKTAMADLLTRKTPEAIRKHFEKWPYNPFTGKKEREAQFRASLNPEQKDAYKRAVRDRRQIAADALRLLRMVQAEAKARREQATEANPFQQ